MLLGTFVVEHHQTLLHLAMIDRVRGVQFGLILDGPVCHRVLGRLAFGEWRWFGGNDLRRWLTAYLVPDAGLVMLVYCVINVDDSLSMRAPMTANNDHSHQDGLTNRAHHHGCNRCGY